MAINHEAYVRYLERHALHLHYTNPESNVNNNPIIMAYWHIYSFGADLCGFVLCCEIGVVATAPFYQQGSRWCSLSTSALSGVKNEAIRDS